MVPPGRHGALPPGPTTVSVQRACLWPARRTLAARVDLMGMLDNLCVCTSQGKAETKGVMCDQGGSFSPIFHPSLYSHHVFTRSAKPRRAVASLPAHCCRERAL